MKNWTYHRKDTEVTLATNSHKNFTKKYLKVPNSIEEATKYLN